MCGLIGRAADVYLTFVIFSLFNSFMIDNVCSPRRTRFGFFFFFILAMWRLLKCYAKIVWRGDYMQILKKKTRIEQCFLLLDLAGVSVFKKKKNLQVVFSFCKFINYTFEELRFKQIIFEEIQNYL